MLLQRAAGKNTWVDVPPPPRAHGDDDSSDEDCGDDDDGGYKETAMEDGEGSSRPEPVVDEDGFQMVSPRRGRGRR